MEVERPIELVGQAGLSVAIDSVSKVDAALKLEAHMFAIFAGTGCRGKHFLLLLQRHL